MKILGLACSHRKNGNSYLIIKEALKDFPSQSEIIQLAEKKINYCTACGLCKDTLKCVINDDVENVLSKMMESDAILISCPRYLPVPSKLMALIERIGAMVHHYPREINPEFRSPLRDKPFGLIIVSAFGGRQAIQILSQLAFYFAYYMEMKPVTLDSYPYIGVSAKGDSIGEVLKDRKAIEQAKRLARKLLGVK